MSAYSTLNITRSKAREKMLMWVMNMPDDVLELLMDKYLEDRLYNCRIIADGDEYNNDEQI